jgi:hypothetical protein
MGCCETRRTRQTRLEEAPSGCRPLGCHRRGGGVIVPVFVMRSPSVPAVSVRSCAGHIEQRQGKAACSATNTGDSVGFGRAPVPAFGDGLTTFRETVARTFGGALPDCRYYTGLCGPLLAARGRRLVPFLPFGPPERIRSTDVSHSTRLHRMEETN